MSDLAPAVRTVIQKCLAVKAGEDVWWSWTPARGRSARRCATRPPRSAADAVLDVMDERATDGTEPPPTGRGGDGGVRRVHRADEQVAQPHAGP